VILFESSLKNSAGFNLTVMDDCMGPSNLKTVVRSCGQVANVFSLVDVVTVNVVRQNSSTKQLFMCDRSDPVTMFHLKCCTEL
jgi:hypothetical protein